MKTVFIYSEPCPITFGELCEALADRVVPARKESGVYEVRKPEVSRLAETMLALRARRAQIEADGVAV